jgi:hypothetical protein
VDDLGVPADSSTVPVASVIAAGAHGENQVGLLGGVVSLAQGPAAK